VFFLSAEQVFQFSITIGIIHSSRFAESKKRAKIEPIQINGLIEMPMGLKVLISDKIDLSGINFITVF
jgi:hypothetical protein